MSEPPPRLEGRLGILLDQAIDLVPRAVGAGLVAFHHEPEPGGRVRGGRGSAAAIDELQLRRGDGVLWLAAAGNIPAVSLDLWSDERCPALRPRPKGLPAPLSAIAVPGVASLEDDLLLTAYTGALAREELEAVVAALVRLVEADARRLVRDVGSMLAGRRHIEQAKGLLMAIRHCGAREAFEVLRQTSQRHQIKVHDLAVALLEAVSSQPAEPATPSPVSMSAPSERARQVAGELARRYLE